MKETAKTIALVVLGVLFVLLALHEPAIPKPVEHPVELSPAYLSSRDELARTKDALAKAQAELKAYKAAAAAATAEGQRQGRWAAAADAEARGALRTASRLYDDYARNYPGTKQAQLAASRAKKLLADFEAARASATGSSATPPATAPRR